MTDRRASDIYDSTAWISRGFEELAASRDCEPASDTVDFDVVIVGSGYGGAIAAANLAGATARYRLSALLPMPFDARLLG